MIIKAAFYFIRADMLFCVFLYISCRIISYICVEWLLSCCRMISVIWFSWNSYQSGHGICILVRWTITCCLLMEPCWLRTKTWKLIFCLIISWLICIIKQYSIIYLLVILPNPLFAIWNQSNCVFISIALFKQIYKPLLCFKVQ